MRSHETTTMAMRCPSDGIRGRDLTAPLAPWGSSRVTPFPLTHAASVRTKDSFSTSTQVTPTKLQATVIISELPTVTASSTGTVTPAVHVQVEDEDSLPEVKGEGATPLSFDNPVVVIELPVEDDLDAAGLSSSIASRTASMTGKAPSLVPATPCLSTVSAGTTSVVSRTGSVSKPRLVYPSISHSSSFSHHRLNSSYRAPPPYTRDLPPMQQPKQDRHLTSAAVHVSRRGNYDVVAVAFWLLILEEGTDLELTKGKKAAADSSARRPSTSSGIRLGTSGRLFNRTTSKVCDISMEGLGPAGPIAKDTPPSLFSWEKWVGSARSIVEAKFTLRIDKSPYPQLSWAQTGLFGQSNRIVRVYTSTKVDSSLWEFLLETSKGPLHLRAPSKDLFLIWTDGLRSILRYARELNAIR